jgi:hypothetical protein
MQVVLTIPDNIAAEIQNGSALPIERRILELAAIQAHLADLLTEREVMEMLGFDDREELWEFFKRYDVRSKHTSEDFAKSRDLLSSLLAQQHG